ncbi:MAG: PmoA family protein, partial [Cyclobacteriaceae bacterium]
MSYKKIPDLSSFFILLGFGLAISCSSPPILNIELDAGNQARVNSPLRIPLSQDFPTGSDYHLLDDNSQRAYPAQILENGDLAIFIDEMPKGFQSTFGLRQGKIKDWEYKILSLVQNEEGIAIEVADQPLLFYQVATAMPPEGLPEYYKRSGMIHPLYSPSGKVLTDDFPVGHTHQHAIFNAWVNTQFKGEKVDFWNQHQGTGTVEHVGILDSASGTTMAGFKTLLSHISLKHGEVLEEEWQIIAYPVEEYFLFDLISEQVNTSQDTLFIVDYHYGGMGFRGSKEWNIEDSIHYTNDWKILTSEGYSNENANHTHASWVDASGKVEGETAGLTVFGFPDNYRYPQPIRVHPSMPYWVYAPMVDGEFTIAPGERFKSKFRYYVHQGEPDL